MKLHELLAIDGSAKAQADKTRTELMATFKNKTHLFTEKTKSFKPDDENMQAAVEEQLDLQTTVKGELKWISEFLIKSMDISYQVAEANTFARADVLMEDGSTLLSQLPATALLELEKRVRELQDFVKAIPTLDPAKGFRADPARGEGIYKAREDVQTRTKKTAKPLTLAPATDKHPAQVQLITEDVPVGKITTLEWSGLITTADKGNMIARCEELARAVKQARSRANDADLKASDNKTGAKVIGYVFGM